MQAMREPKKKKSKGTRRLSGSPKHQKSTSNFVRSNSSETKSLQRSWQGWAWDAVCAAFGVALACYLGSFYATHVKQLHENELWFSHISQLEREISFRTEAGLYYSYYKQLVEAPSLLEGLSGLMHDNWTESMRTINVLRRFNILQEVILATLYRWLPIKQLPVYFYTDAVFGLHGAYLVALICTAWLLSGSILGGALAFLFYLFNKADATRVVFAIPLRESFALPFIATQVLFTTLYLHHSRNPAPSKLQGILLWLVFLTSLCTAVSWQFAQFVFLLQGCALFATQVLGLAPTRKVWNLMLSHTAALLVAHVLQFFNPMLLGSPTLAFTLAAGAVFLVQHWVEGQGHCTQSRNLILVRTIGSSVSVLVLTAALCGLFKRLLCIGEDDHIFKFVITKLGLVSGSPQETRDFDSLLYLCQAAFRPLPLASLSRLAASLLLPCYLVTVAGLLGLIGWWLLCRQHTAASTVCLDSSLPGHKEPTTLKPITRTESDSSACSDASSSADMCTSVPVTTDSTPVSSGWAYAVFQSLLFGLVALSAQRFCYLWVPQACVVAAAGVGNSHAWRAALEKFGCSDKMGKAVHLLGAGALIAALLLREVPGLLQELHQLREFYDPDTVQLMQWIISETPTHTVFAGSMQLLAGVKLCTGRSITNHPHFENKELRERTLQVYQLYARQSPEYVYESLALLGTDYIILEDSICLARWKPDNHNCALPDLMDIVNGHNSSSSQPRFCDTARYGKAQYSKYFKGVFENRTFRVYRLSPKSKPV